MEERDQTQDTERDVNQEDDVEGHQVKDTDQVKDSDDVTGHSFVDSQIEDAQAEDA